MLGDYDPSRKIQQPQLFVCRPNRTTITKLTDAFDINLDAKLNSVNELTFSLPYQKITKHELQNNPHIKLVKDRYLIRYVNGNQSEYFVIIDPEIDINEDTNIRTYHCYSQEYQLSGYYLGDYSTIEFIDGDKIDTPINATNLLTDVLSGTGWSVGAVDASFDIIYRTFSESNTNSLTMIQKGAETFQAITLFDTMNKKVSYVPLSSVGTDKGLRFSERNLAKSVKHKKSRDNFCTQLHIYGKDGISINSVNATGTSYLEDFSYYLYPYQEDENGNVIQSSDYMDDDLCHAIIAYNKKVESKQSDFNNLLTQLSSLQDTLTTKQNELDTLNTQLQQIIDSINVAQSSNQTTTSLQTQKTNKQQEIASKQSEIDSIETQISEIYDSIDSLQNDLKLENNFTPDLLAKRMDLNWVKGMRYENTNISNPQELLQDGIAEFDKFRIPQTTIEMDIVNFLEIVDQQKKWNKLNLGDTVRIYYPQFDIDVKAIITEIKYNFENSEISIVISNVSDMKNDMEQFIKDIGKIFSSTNTVNSYKSNWNSVDDVRNTVNTMRNSILDAAMQAIKAGTNETVLIDRSGITASDSNDPNRLLRMNHAAIIMSKDGGRTAATAITPDGVVADTLVGKILAGNNLLIQNTTGTFAVDGNGVTVSGQAFTVTGGIADGQIAFNQSATNGTRIDSTNGIVVTRGDGKVKTTMNAVDGIKIEQKSGSTWQKMFYTDPTTGTLYLTNIDASGTINASQFLLNGQNALTSNGLLNGQYIENVNAGTIKVGTLSGVNISGVNIDGSTITGTTITGGSITSNTTINVTTDMTIGKYLYMSPQYQGGIKWNNTAELYIDPNTKLLTVRGYGATSIGTSGTNTYLDGNVVFSNTKYTSTVESHNHGIPEGTQLLYGHYDSSTSGWVVDGGVSWTASGGHSHTLS